MSPTRSLIISAIALAGAALSAGCDTASDSADPHDGVPKVGKGVDHSLLIDGPFEDGPSVTRACLQCHPDAATEVMATSHWTWQGNIVINPETGEEVALGKANAINNFCIGTQPNIAGCSKCHAGYGWKTQDFDHSPGGDPTTVDCLVCHEQTGGYFKVGGGGPGEGVDLVAAAKSVGRPTRANCGVCHFNGGGGNGVKHGDLDGSLLLPDDHLDVHMGGQDMQCVDCHKTTKHDIPGCEIGVCIDRPNRPQCTDCHDARPHDNARLDAHTDSVACQTCHIPFMAIDVPTKMTWDWSTAGQDLDIDDPHVYMKIKGSFHYERNAQPEYRWYSRSRGATRYLAGQTFDPNETLELNTLCGAPTDPDAKLWPVKVHRAIVPYDTVYNYLLIPKTVGEGGYWTEFDWEKAFSLATETTGLKYSGHYGWAKTEMTWPLSHMVQPADKALQCRDCHGGDGRLDWQQLGYDADPAFKDGHLDLELVQDPTQFRADEGLDAPPIRFSFPEAAFPQPTVCRKAAKEVNP